VVHVDLSLIGEYVRIFSGLGGVALLTWVVRAINKRVKDHQELRAEQQRIRRKELDDLHGRDNLLADGLRGIQHHDLYLTCTHYLERGWVTTADLDDLEYLYKPYKALGGNGTGQMLYNRVHQLKIKEGE
jgi:hypothetical protein